MHHRPLHALLLTVLLTGVMSASASAALIRLTPDLELETGWISGVFGDAPNQFSDAALQSIHTSLWNSGIETDDRVTVLGLDTDYGTSLIFLIDGPGIGSGGGDASLSFQSTAPIGRTAWINDQPDDIAGSINGASGKQVAWGLFNWDPLLEGDGFAWSNLQPGDGISAMFAAVDESTWPELQIDDTFQFVGAVDAGWAVLDTASFSSAGYYSFTAQVVPAPGAFALLVIAGVRRRRRR